MLKDWKKTSEYTYKKGTKILGYRKVQGYMGNLKIKNVGWEVLAVDTKKGGYLTLTKQFKTKSAALAYAKAYMRKH